MLSCLESAVVSAITISPVAITVSRRVTLKETKALLEVFGVWGLVCKTGAQCRPFGGFGRSAEKWAKAGD